MRVASDADVTLVCRVTVVLAGFSPTGVMGLGDTLHVEFAGAPLHATLVAAVNPPLGVTETVVVAGLP
jgi:hypothetical protein